MELVILAVIVSLTFFGYCHYLDAKDNKAIDKKREEELALLKLRLKTELLVPRSKIRIKTFDDTFYSKYFTAKIISRWCSDDYIYTSKDGAENYIKNSFESGYFVTNDGIHIPIRVIKCVQIV